MYLIKIKTQFEAFHRYKNAPREVKFLKEWHRHIFYVEAYKETDHSDRDIEFFMMKKKLDEFIDKKYKGKKFEKSCETIAEELSKEFEFKIVEVSEDNENSGIYINDNLY